MGAVTMKVVKTVDDIKAPQCRFTMRTEGTPLAGVLNKKLESRYIRDIWIAGMRDQFPFSVKDWVIQEKDRGRIRVHGRWVTNLASYSYLGLEKDLELFREAERGYRKFGTTAAASRVLHSASIHYDLESEIARTVRSESALVGVNVTTLNLGVISGLFGNDKSTIFVDHFAHATLNASAQLAKASGAKVVRVNGRELDRLHKILEEAKSEKKVLLVDGVNSMNGGFLNLKNIDQICKKTGTVLFVDDAHGFGVYGTQGGGVLQELGVGFENVILTGSILKSVGSAGAFVAGNATLIDLIKSTSFSFIFSDPLPVPAAYSGLAAIKRIRSPQMRRSALELRRLSRKMRELIVEAGFETFPGDSPNIPIVIGSTRETYALAYELFLKGFYVNAIIFPAVPRNGGVLRVNLTVHHTEQEIQDFGATLKKLKDQS